MENKRFICPNCKWDFHARKNKCCPGCGIELVLWSDRGSLWGKKNFWIQEEEHDYQNWRFEPDFNKTMVDAMNRIGWIDPASRYNFGVDLTVQ